MENVKRAGELLADILSDRNRFDPEAVETGRKMAGLFNFWASASCEAGIGAACDHSRIREFEHGVLVIEAEHPGWVQILQTKQKQLLYSVQRKFPELNVMGLSFCLSRSRISRNAVSADAFIEQSQDDSAADQTDDDSPDNHPADSQSVQDRAAGISAQKNDAVHESIRKLRQVIQGRNATLKKKDP